MRPLWAVHLRSPQCQFPDNTVHVGCEGLARFDLNGGLGCLCPCHDNDAPPPGHPDYRPSWLAPTERTTP